MIILANGKDDLKELNETIKRNSHLLDPKTLDKWLSHFSFLKKSRKEQTSKKREELTKKSLGDYWAIRPMVKEIMNNNLIPKYRRIVGGQFQL